MSNKRKVIDQYHQACIARDLTKTLSLLDENIFLKSPVDEFTGLKLFEERCWPFGQGTKKFAIRDFIESGDAAFFTYDVLTGWGTFRSAEVFRFKGDKIAAMDIYWGTLPDKLPPR